MAFWHAPALRQGVLLGHLPQSKKWTGMPAEEQRPLVTFPAGLRDLQAQVTLPKAPHGAQSAQGTCWRRSQTLRRGKHGLGEASEVWTR